MPGENLPRRAWNRQTKFMYNYWQAALVKDQVFEHVTNPPCHRGSVNPNNYLINTLYQLNVEVNRPIMFSFLDKWPRRGLNPGPTAP